MNSPDSFSIPDVQNSADTRHLAIDKVGIKSIRHPVRVADRDRRRAIHDRQLQYVRRAAA